MVWNENLRRALTRAFWVLCAALTSISIAEADQARDVHGLAQWLMAELKVSAEDLARLLTRYGGYRDPASEPSLARWPAASLRITILTTGDARASVRNFISDMDGLASRIDRHTAYCVQPLSIAGDGSYAPNLTDVSCLREPSDVIMLIDSSAVPSRALYRDLAQWSAVPEEIQFWMARVDADAGLFQQSSCEERQAKMLNTSTFSLATAYFRVVESDSNYRSCTRALPFMILGQLPIDKYDGSHVLLPEMIELQYSPELHPGMKVSEIAAILGQ